jgi:hypothetical protein
MTSNLPSRELRERTKAINYKEPSESDIPRAKSSKSKASNELFPIEVVDEDSGRYKVHYVGYSSAHDEWKTKSDIVDLDHDDRDDSCCQVHQHRFSLHHELATRVKMALNSSRKESPIVRIDMPFDRIEFYGGLMMLGENKRFVRGIQHYKILRYSDLNSLLGVNWHYRGINSTGDFCYVLLDTIEYYLYKRRSLKEFFPSVDGVVEEKRDVGDMLAFTFVRGDGTPDRFGKDKEIFF